MFKLHDWININFLDIWSLSENPNPNAIDILKNNQDKINWDNLSFNPNTISLLKENKHKIELKYFSKNPNIFTYDYIKMKKTIKDSGIAEELMAYIFNPKNMEKWINWGFTEHQEIIEFIN